MESDTLAVTYVIHNVGELSCFVEMPEMIITKDNDIEGKDPLVEGVDYIFQKRDFPIVKLDSKEKVHYQEMIFFNGKRLSEICPAVVDKISIKATFRVQANPALSSLPSLLRGILGEEALSELFEVEVVKKNSVSPFS